MIRGVAQVLKFLINLSKWHYMILGGGLIYGILLYFFGPHIQFDHDRISWFLINIVNAFIVAIITSDIFYLFSICWSNFKMGEKVNQAIKASLFDILFLHKKEKDFFRTDPTEFSVEEINSLIMLRDKIISQSKSVLNVWSPHLPDELIGSLWSIADDHEKHYPIKNDMYFTLLKNMKAFCLSHTLEVLSKDKHCFDPGQIFKVSRNQNFVLVEEFCSKNYPQEKNMPILE